MRLVPPQIRRDRGQDGRHAAGQRLGRGQSESFLPPVRAEVDIARGEELCHTFGADGDVELLRELGRLALRHHPLRDADEIELRAVRARAAHRGISEVDAFDEVRLRRPDQKYARCSGTG